MQGYISSYCFFYSPADREKGLNGLSSETSNIAEGTTAPATPSSATLRSAVG